MTQKGRCHCGFFFLNFLLDRCVVLCVLCWRWFLPEAVWPCSVNFSGLVLQRGACCSQLSGVFVDSGRHLIKSPLFSWGLLCHSVLQFFWRITEVIALGDGDGNCGQ